MTSRSSTPAQAALPAETSTPAGFRNSVLLETTPESLRAWGIAVKLQLRGLGVEPDSAKAVSHCCLATHGSGTELLLQVVEADRPPKTFEEVRKALLNIIGGTHEALVDRERLYHVTFSGDLEKYILAVNLAVNRLPDERNTTGLTAFLRNLPKDLRERVFTLSPATLDEAYKHARRFSALAGASTVMPQATTSLPDVSASVSAAAASDPELASELAAYIAHRAGFPQSNRGGWGGRTGRGARGGRGGRSGGRGGRSASAWANPVDPSTVCFRCGEKGHQSKGCFKEPQGNDSHQ